MTAFTPTETRPPAAFAELPSKPGRGPLRLEYQWLNPHHADAPVAVFLHEGLGSIAMWRDWPQTLCDRLGYRGLVFSRPGYGRSTSRAAGEKWPTDYLHGQARDVLPTLLDTLGIDARQRARMCLIGHSDGASIALLYAAAFPDALGATVAIAPHVFVEQMSIDAIARSRIEYETAGLREKLSRYHADVDSAFFGWNDVWLDPSFRSWDMTGLLPAITCPLLVIQGYADEYASMAQLDAIQRQVPQARLVKLPACGHSPHREAPETMNDTIAAFIGSA
jgi:pimeloyl-ACP methyl ester carboxylesterase